MKKFILLLLFVSSLSGQTIRPRAEWTTPQHLKDTTTNYTSLQALTRGDSILLSLYRGKSGDAFSLLLRARSLGRSETDIYSGIEAMSKGLDTVKSHVRALANGTVSLGGVNNTATVQITKEYTAPGAANVLTQFSTYTGSGLAVTRQIWRVARGSIASPTQVLAGDQVQLGFRGQNNSTISSVTNASIELVAAETFTTTASGTRVQIRVTPIGTVTATIPLALWGTGLKLGTAASISAPTAWLELPAGTATAGTGPMKFTNGTLLTSPEVGALEMSGDSLYFTRNSGVRVSLAQGGSGGGAGGTAGGWVRTTFIRTDTAGVKVYIPSALSDTTTYSALFNVGGTSAFGNDVTFFTDWYYQATKIFENSDTSFINAAWKGDTVESAYIGSRLSNKTIDGASFFTGSGGINTAGNVTSTGVLSVLNIGGTQATFGYNSGQKFTIDVNSSGVATLTATGGITMALDGSNIANVSITAAKIAAGTITSNEIQNATITGTDIAAATIAGSNIASATIAGSNLVNATVTGSKIASATITGTNIVSGTITGGLIASATIAGGNIAANTVTGGNIDLATIQAGNIANLTITAAQIANLTINGTKITSETLDSTKLKDGSISGPDIAAHTVRAANIAALTITASEIAATTITGAKIAANTIAAGNIVANTITASEIAANTITATQIASATITGTQISASTSITAGTGNDVAILSGADATYRIWAGNATAASAPFSVTKAGAITATSGTIGGWTLAATNLTASTGTVGISSAVTGGDDIRFWAGHATPSSAAFRVTEAGVLTASSATITGTITTTASGARVLVGSGTGYGYVDFYTAGGYGGSVNAFAGSYPSLSISSNDELSFSCANWNATAISGSITFSSGANQNISLTAGSTGAYAAIAFTGATHTFNGNTIWSAANGYVTSAYGTKTAFSPNAQYLTTIADVHDVQVYKRAITINGVTVNVLVVD
jgi:hypothetical protein